MVVALASMTARRLSMDLSSFTIWLTYIGKRNQRIPNTTATTTPIMIPSAPMLVPIPAMIPMMNSFG